MIFLGLGANLPSVAHGEPIHTLSAALALLAERGVSIVRRSRWFRTAPLPISDQPWFINAVAAVETDLPPLELLHLLQQIERELGRERHERWGARVIDLDLLAYHNSVINPGVAGAELIVPHARLHERAFVLRPLQEIAPEWRHPRFGLRVDELQAALPPGQQVEPVGSG